MQRIFYAGDGETDPRLAGVELFRGKAVDVPEEMVDDLLAGDFSLEAPPPESLVVEEESTWYEPPPGEELTGLPRIGPSRAELLVERGISTLADMADLDPDAISDLAEALPGVSEDQVYAWVQEAEVRKLE